MSWRIFYADGTQYALKDGPWQDAPVYGVVVISGLYNGVKYVVHGHSFYWLDAQGRVTGADWKDVPLPRPVCKIGDSINLRMYHYWLKVAEETPV